MRHSFEKDPFGSTSEFSLSNFDLSTPSPLFNVVTAQLNVRGLGNTMDETTLLLKVCRFDIFEITETFLDEGISDKQLHVENYKIVRRDRNCCLIYIASHICYSRLKSLESPDIELIWIKIIRNSSALILGNCYQPPSDFQFYSRFYDCLEKVWLKHRNVLLRPFS